MIRIEFKDHAGEPLKVVWESTEAPMPGDVIEANLNNPDPAATPHCYRIVERRWYSRVRLEVTVVPDRG